MRHLIWMIPLTLSLALALTASPAYAWHCPKLASEAKEVIAKAESMNGDQELIDKAKKLVDEGEAQHAAGEHNEAMETLAKAVKKGVYSVTGGYKKGGHKSRY